jgi:hypothetical protein
LLYHPKQKPRRGGSLRQINTCRKVPYFFLDIDTLRQERREGYYNGLCNIWWAVKPIPKPTKNCGIIYVILFHDVNLSAR